MTVRRWRLLAVLVLLIGTVLSTRPAKAEGLTPPTCQSSYDISIRFIEDNGHLPLGATRLVVWGGPETWDSGILVRDELTITNADGSTARPVKVPPGQPAAWEVEPRGNIDVSMLAFVYAPEFHGGDELATVDAYRAKAPADCVIAQSTVIQRSRSLGVHRLRWIRTARPWVIEVDTTRDSANIDCDLFVRAPVRVTVTVTGDQPRRVIERRANSVCDFFYDERYRFSVKPNLQIEGTSRIEAVVRLGDRIAAASTWTTRVWIQRTTNKRPVYADSQAYWAECIPGGYKIWIDDEDNLFCYLDVTSARRRWSFNRVS